MNTGTTKFQIKRRGHKSLYSPTETYQRVIRSEFNLSLEFTLDEALKSNLPDAIKVRLKTLTAGRVIALHRGAKLSIILGEGNVQKNLAKKRQAERIADMEKEIARLQKKLESELKSFVKNFA